MSVGAELGSAMLRKIHRTARGFTMATGKTPSKVRVPPVDLEHLKSWSKENLWFIVNDDTGDWTVEGIPLVADPTLPRGEVRVE